VIGVNVSFQYDEGSFDRARVMGVADKARATFEGMPGLRFKSSHSTNPPHGRAISTSGIRRNQRSISSLTSYVSG
jgi:hypothetical protein